MDDVFDARIASGFRIGQSAAKILTLIASFSVAASITMSQSAKASLLVAVAMRPSAAALSSALSSPFFTCRSMLPDMVASALSSAACCTSISTTDRPDCAATCAMPLPIRPAPMTPSVLISAMSLPPSGVRAAA